MAIDKRLPALLRGTALTALATAAVALTTPAAAQDQPTTSAATGNPDVAASTGPDQATADIVVTGSRISRRDYEANSPIVTANDALLKQSSSAALETNLNKLPQFTPVQTPTLGGDVQPTATNTPGAATISLRGLGTNRNLVLLDGRRATPSNATQVVDINSLPQVAIDRVEIITGGASATYGADAVGGVVNFILKKNFTGFDIDSQIGVTERGDNLEYRVSGIIGTNFADGRGNVSLAMETNQRHAARRINRPWFQKAFKDPTLAGTNIFSDFPAFQAYQSQNAPSTAAVQALFPTGVLPTDRVYFNTDGTAFTGFFQSPAAGSNRFKGDLTGLKWKRNTNGTLSQNFLDELLILPLKRWNMYARGSYELNDWISVFGQAIFSQVGTHTVQEPSPAVNGWSALIPVANHPVPTELATLLASRANPTGPWQLTQRLNFANRTSSIDVTSYNMVAGFQGKVPGSDWTFEVYGSQGRSSTATTLGGFASLERYRAIVTAPNWGAGFKAQGNALFGGFGASTATCTSGLNPFSNAAISRDCIEAITADLQSRSVMQQTVWEGTAQGSLIKLPAGDLKVALGADYRSNKYDFQNDTLTTQGRSFLDQAIGLYPSGNSGGKIITKEAYGELLVPILADTFIKKADLELGGRVSNYNTTGTSYTYKILGDIEVTNWLRFRGGYNRAERTPNIAELYLSPQQTFVFAAAGDPCSINNTLPYSANPKSNPTNAAKVKALCSALMNRVDPNTSAKFYADPSFQTSGGTFAFPSQVGNPTLKPEKADTWTAGIVLRSPFDNELLRSLRLTVDYYNIKVKDAIGLQSIDTAQRQCLDAAFNPTFDINSPFCTGVQRVTGDGAIGNVQTTYYNNGRFKTSGIDFQLDGAFDVGPGKFTINSVVNYLLYLKSAELSVLPLADYAGSLGPAQNGLNAGAFRWKMLNTFGYNLGVAGLSLQWQHLPKVRSASYPVNQTLGVATTLTGAKAYDLFNLSANVKITSDALVRFGVDNLFDKAPPIVEINTAAPAGTLAGGDFNDYFYDLNGRRFYMGASFKF